MHTHATPRGAYSPRLNSCRSVGVSACLRRATTNQMHELLVSRGFVRRADAPDLAEVKEREAVANAAAAAARKERAEASAKRRLERENDKKLGKEDAKVRMYTKYMYRRRCRLFVCDNLSSICNK